MDFDDFLEKKAASFATEDDSVDDSCRRPRKKLPAPPEQGTALFL